MWSLIFLCKILPLWVGYSYYFYLCLRSQIIDTCDRFLAPDQGFVWFSFWGVLFWVQQQCALGGVQGEYPQKLPLKVEDYHCTIFSGLSKIIKTESILKKNKEPEHNLEIFRNTRTRSKANSSLISLFQYF